MSAAAATGVRCAFRFATTLSSAVIEATSSWTCAAAKMASVIHAGDVAATWLVDAPRLGPAVVGVRDREGTEAVFALRLVLLMLD